MKRHKYRWHHRVGTYGTFLRALPWLAEEVSPGDTWSGVGHILVRLSPLKRALIQDLRVEAYLFYVPHRLVWDKFETFVEVGPLGSSANSGFQGGTAAVSPPLLSTIKVNGDDELFMPRAKQGTPYNALRRRAYNLVYNEYLRDEQAALITADTELPTGGQLVAPLRNWVTLLRLSPDLGISAEASVTFDTQSATAAVAHVDYSEILRARAEYRAQQMRSFYGTRYHDILRSYGIRTNYQMLQRPEIVARARSKAHVSDVVETDSAGLGKLAGYGIDAIRVRMRRRSFPEHGTLLGLMWIRPDIMDEAFTDYMVKSNRVFEDFYDPFMGILPPTAIQVRDVFDNAAAAVDQNVLGYAPHYEWLRKPQNRLRTGMDEWYTNPWRKSDGSIPASWADLQTFGHATDADTLFSDTTYGHFQVRASNRFSKISLVPRSGVSVLPGHTSG